MSKRRSNSWRAAARSAAQDYPRLCRELEALQTGSREQDGMPTGRGAARPTEDAVLRQLPYHQQRRLDAVEHAITISSQLTSGPSRVKLIELVYLKQSHTVQGAAMQIPVSERQAWTWNSDFLLLVWGQLKGK